MRLKANAKINLCLDVKSKRDDGYHNLEMIMVPIDFYDVIDIELSNVASLKSNAQYLPIDTKNTMIKAIEEMRKVYRFEEDFAINIVKHIPTQAGLAGGSTDAAAVIEAINKILDLKMSLEDKIEIAKKVGSDVPFFILNEPCVVKGTGELLQTFDVNCHFHVFLVKPRKGVSTKLAFETLDIPNAIHPDCEAMKNALINNDYHGVINSLGNSLEQSSFKLVPEIENIKNELIELGFDGALMSGSGSTVFALTKDLKVLDKANHVMKAKGYFVRKTRILKK